MTGSPSPSRASYVGLVYPRDLRQSLLRDVFVFPRVEHGIDYLVFDFERLIFGLEFRIFKLFVQSFPKIFAHFLSPSLLI